MAHKQDKDIPSEHYPSSYFYLTDVSDTGLWLFSWTQSIEHHRLDPEVGDRVESPIRCLNKRSSKCQSLY
jgi:hypothetical protein